MMRVELRIRGLVQGVAYRASAARAADRLGLRGWVRNRADGSVELAAEGPAATLERLVVWCRQGPPGARVASVDEDWREVAPGDAEPPGFRIEWTSA